MIDEPIRGGFPDPSFYSQPGIDQARAWMRGLVPRSPLSHLTGYRLTHVGSGSATFSLPASPWLQNLDGSLELRILVETALYTAALAGAPASHEVRTAAVSWNHLRWCTLESEALVARAKTVNTGRSFTVTEVQVEDSLGRAVVTATGSVVVQPRDPPLPPLLQPMQPVVSPLYPTPDPPARVLPNDVFPFGILDELDSLSILSQMAKGELPHAPIFELLGGRLVDVTKGTVVWTLRTSQWHCIYAHDVSPGVIAFLAAIGLAGAPMTLCPSGQRLGVVAVSVSFLRPVAPDGRDLLARGRVLHEGGRFLVSAVEVTDSDGNRVALGQQTSLLVPKQPRAHGDTDPERLLATVLFTDIVGSTKRADELGDARWRELLDEHHAFVRKQLQVFRGREVKTTGDGFLATFDSPGRAVQCARAIRDGVRYLGLASPCPARSLSLVRSTTSSPARDSASPTGKNTNSRALKATGRSSPWTANPPRSARGRVAAGPSIAIPTGQNRRSAKRVVHRSARQIDEETATCSRSERHLGSASDTGWVARS